MHFLHQPEQLVGEQLVGEQLTGEQLVGEQLVGPSPLFCFSPGSLPPSRSPSAPLLFAFLEAHIYDPMKQNSLLLLGVLPALAAAYISQSGACLPGGINNGATAGTSAKFREIKGKGDLAVVAWDPTDAEKTFSCVVISFSRRMTYTLKYKDQAGVHKEVIGRFIEERIDAPKHGINEARFYLQDVPTGILNGGQLYPMLVEGNDIILQGCRFGWPSNITTYLLVPLRTAKFGTANSGCSCEDWRSA
ncbi:hypothetical protein FHG87_010272 [Trinorchestia longiramus]|nr:hypothetical protein FHG87_010272 [Trinorchestia longiramus]